jgi:hypothetical protein
VSLAMDLLSGLRHKVNGLSEFTFLSGNTKPTESEAREALARVLLRGDVPEVILWALAAVFDPNCLSPLSYWNQQRVVLKRLNQGHSNPTRDYEIADWVDELRRDGLSYDEAAEKVAETAQISQDHIKKIYGGINLGFGPPPRARRKSRR